MTGDMSELSKMYETDTGNKLTLATSPLFFNFKIYNNADTGSCLVTAIERSNNN